MGYKMTPPDPTTPRGIPRPSRAPRQLRRFRLSMGWTMAEAAEWYGVTESAWWRWEAGRRPVPLHVLIRIRDAL